MVVLELLPECKVVAVVEPVLVLLQIIQYLQTLLTVEMEPHLPLQDLLSQKVAVVEVVLMFPVHLVVKEDLAVVLMDLLKALIKKHQVHQQTLPLVVAVVVEHKDLHHHLVETVVPESFT
tara:strand:- start:101 stop:460 length:360 start_codon:yes stop_codon:yes gene_type:complete